jgi:hypothetical protein
MSQCNQKRSCWKEGSRHARVRGGDIKTEAEVTMRQSHEQKNVNSSQELEKDKEMDSPRVSRRSTTVNSLI